MILTIAFLFVMQLVALNWSWLTNGNHGLTLPLPQWDRQYQDWPFYYSLFGLLALAVALSAWIRRTKLGMGLLAIREDESKASCVGVTTPVYKIAAFAASAVFIGAAGGIYAYYLTFIDPRGMFDVVVSVQVVLAALLGGRGTLWGPVLGAFILEPLNETTNNEIGGGNWRLIFFGGLLALVVLVLPRGIIPSLVELQGRWRGRRSAAPVGARLERPALAGGTSRLSETRAPAGGTSRLSETRAPAGGTSRLSETRAPAGGTSRFPQTPSTGPLRGQAPTAPPSTGPLRGQAPTAPLLDLRELSKHFGGVQALAGCSLGVEEGTITGLIGPNGSGKTTLFNVIDGTMPATGGEVWLDGRRIDRLKPWTRAHLGIGRTFQITRLFRELTVLENVVAPLRSFSWRQLAADAVSGPEAARAEELLDFVGMRPFAGVKAGTLSFGQQKLVELAQVLMLDPKLILLDEPAGGVNPTLVEQITELIRELNRGGTTFLIVEHNMPLVLSLCDPVNVLARGSCISRGSPAEIQADPRVLDAYLGEEYQVERPAAVS